MCVFFKRCSLAAATWSYDAASGVVNVDWKKYGNYQLTRTGSGSLEGSVAGNPSKWRKMDLVRAFTPAELLLFGEGGGSVWEMTWEKGSVGEIEFRTDGFNHFVSNSYPAHSHWSIDATGTRVTLDWGKYGTYDLVIDADAQSMEGHKAGQPANWRRVRFVRPLSTEALGSVPSHDHAHSHAHGKEHNHEEGGCCGSKKAGGGDCCDEEDCCDDEDCCDKKAKGKCGADHKH